MNDTGKLPERRASAVYPRWAASSTARYGLAVIVTTIAVGLNHYIQEFIDAPSTALFFASVLVSTLYGGLGPGLLSIVIATASKIHFLAEPSFSLAFGLSEGFRVSMLLLEAVVISWLATRRKTAEAELRILNSELEQRVRSRTADLEESNRQLQDFSYTIAHDLRAPLRAMQGFSQALLEEADCQLSEHGQDFARRISAASQRMDQLIRDLLEYTHLSQSQLSLTPEDCRSLLEQVLEHHSGEIQERNAAVELTGAHWPLVLAHGPTLQRVLSELLSNALKFVPPEKEPRIRIQIQPLQEKVRIGIEDNGPGIEPRFHEKIFGVFERLDPNAREPGTGIGLAIAKRAVERMQGSISLESQPGQGTRFWIELPRCPQENRRDLHRTAGARPSINGPGAWENQ